MNNPINELYEEIQNCVRDTGTYPVRIAMSREFHRDLFRELFSKGMFGWQTNSSDGTGTFYGIPFRIDLNLGGGFITVLREAEYYN